MGDELVKVKGGLSAEGGEVELSVGKSLPGAIAKMFPTWALRTDMRRSITGSIIHKLESGGTVDRADVDFVANVIGEQEGIWLRRKEIAMRAERVLAEQPPPALPPKSEEAGNTGEAAGTGGTTADEWVRRFWEDAGAISDEVLQEIYARLLAGEARAPNSCSMRTLRALRYMDRATADNFATILPYVVDNNFIPAAAARTLPFKVLRDLNDAGLFDFRKDVVNIFPTRGPFFFRWGTRIFGLGFEPFNEHDKPQLGVFLLRSAGAELARVANVDRTNEFGDSFALQLADLPGAHVRTAVMPSLDWVGHVEELSWTEVIKAAP